MANTYYVDKTLGDNGGTGEIGDPWETLTYACTQISAGDTLKLKKGEEWHEEMLPPSGSIGNIITFTHYGSGNDPIINGSDLVNSWTEESSNLWYATLANDPPQVFFDETRGNEQSAKVNVDSDKDWWHDSGNTRLYVYSTSDPDTAYTSPGVEASERFSCTRLGGDDYITIDGLHLKQSEDGNIWMDDNSTYNEVKNCTIHGGYNYGVNINGTGCSHNLVDSCTIYHNGVIDTAAGVRTRGSYEEIKDSTIYGNLQVGGSEEDGSAVRLVTGADHCSVHGNTMYDNGGAGGTAVEIYDATDNEVYQNLMYNSRDLIEFGDGANNNKIYYNIMYGGTGASGIIVGLFVSPSTGNEIYNNVIDANGYYGISVYCANTTIKNNIVYNVSGAYHALYWSYDAGFGTLDYNCYEPNDSGDVAVHAGVSTYTLSEWQSYSSQDANSIDSDPSFVNPGSHDYHLQSGSPCVDAGVDVSLTEDYDGNTVPYNAIPDIGAFEKQRTRSKFFLIKG